jgi:hypothetical protein
MVRVITTRRELIMTIKRIAASVVVAAGVAASGVLFQPGVVQCILVGPASLLVEQCFPRREHRASS